MGRPAKARIDLAAIQHNYQLAKRISGSKAAAIIKANAYGHGAVRVAQALQNEADAFGVACIEEALELRESGITPQILLLEGVFTPDELVLADRLNMAVALHTPEQLQWLLAARLQNKLNVFLKLDTGMHRLGFSPELAREIYAQLKDCAHVGSVTLMTHFSRADEVNENFTAVQIDRFVAAVKGIEAQSSLANSAGLLAWPAAHGDWVRPGIMLYGADPLDQANQYSAQLRPAMSLESELIAVRELSAGESIGYGARFRCEGQTRVGVVAMGYADGYPRHAKDGTPVLVKGQSSRIIGRVSMDMLTVDLSDIPDAVVGDPVELWGKRVAANDVAAMSDTIAYTLFTGVTRRVPLVYS
ncbi:MAG: alanine racemase [Thiolinea sp.]